MDKKIILIWMVIVLIVILSITSWKLSTISNAMKKDCNSNFSDTEPCPCIDKTQMLPQSPYQYDFNIQNPTS
jgi:hypothetical protein